jgi:hypothetical protein
LSRALKVKLSRTKLPRTLRRRDTENAERHGARGEKNYEESTEKAQSTRRKMWGEGWMISESKNPVHLDGVSVLQYNHLHCNDVGSLKAFGTFLGRELDALTFFQVAEAVTLDSGIMDEDIVSAFTLDEAVAFATIKPLDCTDDSFRHFFSFN